MSRGLLVALMLGWASGVLGAAEPLVTYILPAGGQVGTRTIVRCGGLFESWPVNVWTDDRGLSFEAGETNGTFTVEIAGETRVGPHLVRMFDPAGPSAPALFVVGEYSEFVHGPGQTAACAPIDKFPCVLNGAITETNRVDTYRLLLPRNCMLNIEVCALGLDSPLRANIELLDGATNRVALVESESDRDPALLQSIIKDGTYLLCVSGVIKADSMEKKGDGLEAGVYRALVSVNSAPQPVGPTTESARPVAEIVEMFRPMVAVRTLMVPSVTRGVISPAGRNIYYGFETRGQERFGFKVRAASIGSPLVPTLRILDSAMQPIVEALPGSDAELVWVSPAEGNYIVAVSDAQGNGGPVYSFQLEVDVPKPFFRATVSRHTYRLKPGGTTTVAVGLSRPATATSILHVSAVGLPDGVSVVPQTAEPGVTEVKLELRVDGSVAPANRPFFVNVVNVGSVPPEVDSARAPIKGRHAPAGKLLINETEHIWLTVEN